MKTILCFGDSNTHGSNPADSSRFDHETRWPGFLRKIIQGSWWIIEEGCGGRTTVIDDPLEPDKNGAAYLPACLNSHKPIDLVILLLGTNDLKERFGVGPREIARNAGTLVDLCKNSASGPEGSSPLVLLIAPPPLAPLAGTKFETMFKGGEEKSLRLGYEFSIIAKAKNCPFLDLNGVVTSSPIDGIHWEEPEHAKLAHAVAKKILELFPS